MQDWIYLVAAMLTAYFILGVTGFGSALVLVPVLASRWPLAEAATFAILLDIPASMLHGGLNLRQVRWDELRRMLPGLTVGTLLGLWLMGQVDKGWLLLALGLYVMSVGVRLLRTIAAPPPADGRWAHVAGTLIGLVEVMFATAGPIVVAWLQRRLTHVAPLRATVPVVMVLAGTIAVAVLASSAKIDGAKIWPLWLLGLPIAATGVLLGNRVAAHLNPLFMKRLMAVLLCISGLALTRHFHLP